MNKTAWLTKLPRARIAANKKQSRLLTPCSHIAEALGKGEKVDLRRFGGFQVSEKKERQGRNPRTGETLTIAAKKVAVFKPSKELAERVNGVVGAGDEASP